MKKIILILLVFGLVKANAQFPKVDIPGTEVRKITSSVVKDQEYELHISLPNSYKNSKTNYPVVYVMDAQWDFPLVRSIYGQQYYDGFIPEMIVVGVTWSGPNANPDILRTRDYTPTKEARYTLSGGADNFLSFMKEELFPFIETNYRADSLNRTMIGCSLGGLITLYALFTHTDMFKGYVAASPAIGWDKEVIYKYEKDFYEKSLRIKKMDSSIRMYMTIGDVERAVPEFERFSDSLKKRNYTSLVFRSKVLENTGHSGTKSETFSRGLQYVFERAQLQFPEAELQRYVGTYGTGAGKYEVKIENGRLALYLPNGTKYLLFAGRKAVFYSTSEFLNIFFHYNEREVRGFDIQRYGSYQVIKKEN